MFWYFMIGLFGLGCWLYIHNVLMKTIHVNDDVTLYRNNWASVRNSQIHNGTWGLSKFIFVMLYLCVWPLMIISLILDIIKYREIIKKELKL